MMTIKPMNGQPAWPLERDRRIDEFERFWGGTDQIGPSNGMNHSVRIF
jgi:hypothetical protein